MADRYTVSEVSGYAPDHMPGRDGTSRTPGLSAHVVPVAGRYPYQPLASFRSEDYPRQWGQARRIAAAREAAQADCDRRNAEYEAWLAGDAA